MTPQGDKNNQNSRAEDARQSKKVIKCEGRVIETLPNTLFKIVLDDGRKILGVLSGKMHLHRITILPGDRVSVEMTPYDQARGRIVYRLK